MANILQFPNQSRPLLAVTSVPSVTSASDEAPMWNERLVDESRRLIAQSTRYRDNALSVLDQLESTEQTIAVVEDHAMRSALQAIIEAKRNSFTLLHRRLDAEIAKLNMISTEIECLNVPHAL